MTPASPERLRPGWRQTMRRKRLRVLPNEVISAIAAPLRYTDAVAMEFAVNRRFG